MKLLLNPTLIEISEAISGATKEAIVDCRIESYSCKMIAQEKKMYKSLLSEHNPQGLEVLSPTVLSSGIANSLSPRNLSPSVLSKSLDSPPDVLQHSCSTRTLYYLKATLNTAYAPDYDFSSARSEEFCKEPSLDYVQRTLYSHLTTVHHDVRHLSQSLWAELEKEIAPKECDIYSYRPDGDSDPFGEDGTLWSVNYFLYNKRLKRIVFIRASAASTGIPSEDESNQDDDFAGDMSEDDMDISTAVDVPGFTPYDGRPAPLQDLRYLE